MAWKWHGRRLPIAPPTRMHLPRMNPHASLRCLLCSEWVEWDDASCLSLPLASSRFLSSRFLSLLLVLSLPLHTLIRPHARTDAALASIHAHLCTHTYAPTRLPVSMPSRMLTALPFCRCCLLSCFYFSFPTAVGGCWLWCWCLSLLLSLSPASSPPIYHLLTRAPSASCPVSHLPPPLICSNTCPPLYLAPRLISPSSPHAQLPPPHMPASPASCCIGSS